MASKYIGGSDNVNKITSDNPLSGVGGEGVDVKTNAKLASFAVGEPVVINSPKKNQTKEVVIVIPSIKDDHADILLQANGSAYVPITGLRYQSSYTPFYEGYEKYLPDSWQNAYKNGKLLGGVNYGAGDEIPKQHVVSIKSAMLAGVFPDSGVTLDIALDGSNEKSKKISQISINKDGSQVGIVDYIYNEIFKIGDVERVHIVSFNKIENKYDSSQYDYKHVVHAVNVTKDSISSHVFHKDLLSIKDNLDDATKNILSKLEEYLTPVYVKDEEGVDLTYYRMNPKMNDLVIGINSSDHIYHPQAISYKINHFVTQKIDIVTDVVAWLENVVTINFKNVFTPCSDIRGEYRYSDSKRQDSYNFYSFGLINRGSNGWLFSGGGIHIIMAYGVYGYDHYGFTDLNKNYSSDFSNYAAYLEKSKNVANSYLGTYSNKIGIYVPYNIDGGSSNNKPFVLLECAYLSDDFVILEVNGCIPVMGMDDSSGIGERYMLSTPSYLTQFYIKGNSLES